MRIRIPRPLLAVVALSALARVSASGVRILALRSLFDDIRGRADGSEAALPLTVVGLLLASAVVSGIARRFEWSASDSAGYRVVHEARLILHRRLLTGGSVARPGARFLLLSGDLSSLRSWVSRGLLQGTAAALVIVSSVAIVVVLNPLTGAVLAGFLVAGGLLSVRSADRIGAAAREVGKIRSRLADRVFDHVSGRLVPRGFNRVDGEMTRVRRLSDRLTTRNEALAAQRASVRGLADAWSQITALAVALAGFFEVGAGRTTPGTVVAAVLISRQLTSPMRRVMQMPDHRARARRIVRRLGRTEATPTTGSRRAPSSDTATTIQVGRISARSLAVDRRLAPVSFTADAGMKVLIVGPPSSGKTTLLLAMAGLVSADRGTFTVDGHETSGPRSDVAVATSAVPLLEGSIQRTLTYGRSRVDSVEAAVERLGLTGRSADERVEHDGANLSSVERRLLEAGRAFAAGRPVVLLDDVLDGLDPSTRERLIGLIEDCPATVVFTTRNRLGDEPADLVIELEPPDSTSDVSAHTGFDSEVLC